ncbi:LCP family protein [Marinactinospora thermotolerans]|uniref:Transcriptional attenuator, LytR family n=1 Tax=Marinactinospora thermotolerans DSM 45154 TaxID=1122192 RepID=A0A1T4QN84_9ACTN|nr:LCP family protein [Marinactinospora thermotolerans]SKA05230.1 transcriptional attenuator, LytR family [Marinactinospora thermotolerans DSM 45154]
MSVVVLLASGTAWALTSWVSGRLNRFDVFAGLGGDRPAAGATGALDFLVIGSDSRGELDRGAQAELGVGNAAGQRSDTMMLVHVNEDRDQITVIGIPRDSWVRVPGHGEAKINAAYAYGGPQLAIQTVESTTGVRIDHYVEVDFAGFVDVVDALGGIEVCLEEPIYDEKAHLNMGAGTHHVDGTEALAFARTRKTVDGDLDRIDRQQQVMAALLDKALDSDTLGNPDKLTRFLDTALGSVTVDEGLDTAAINQLAAQLRSIKLDDVAFTQVPVSSMDFRTPNGETAVTWNSEAAEELFDKVAADEPLTGKDGEEEPARSESRPGPTPQEVTLEVFNGAGAPGLGARAAADLAGAGFQVPEQASNWPSLGVTQTLVRHAPEQADAAALVAAAIPGAVLEEDTSLSERVQVVVGSGYGGVDAPADTAVAEPAAASGVGAGGRDMVHTSTAQENICA